ncbi:unnamed protein product [Aphanomyces euteiches]
MTVLTEYLNPIKQPVNTAETPLILALYMRSTVLYITGVMVGLAGAMLYYILLSRGHIEVLNLMELQRVGAVVWAGRPDRARGTTFCLRPTKSRGWSLLSMTSDLQ